MKYVAAWTFQPEQTAAVQARFREINGALPQGIKTSGRWHGIGTNKGLCVAESDDAFAQASLAGTWSDLMPFDICPALTGEETAKPIS